MPRHRSLNLKKFIESIPEPLIEEYFKQKVGGVVSFFSTRVWVYRRVVHRFPLYCSFPHTSGGVPVRCTWKVYAKF